MRLINSVLILILLVLQYRVWLGEGSVRHNIELDKKITDQVELNARLDERNAQIAAQVISLQEGTEGIEEYARSQLGMIKPDETFYLVVGKQH
jgi:cell division protein FtsB